MKVNYKMIMKSSKKSIWVGKSLSDYYKEKMSYYDKISEYFSYSSSSIETNRYFRYRLGNYYGVRWYEKVDQI